MSAKQLCMPPPSFKIGAGKKPKNLAAVSWSGCQLTDFQWIFHGKAIFTAPVSKTAAKERAVMRRTSYPQLRSRLVTAEITYRLPDHPHLLQIFVWQNYDTAPDYP